MKANVQIKINIDTRKAIDRIKQEGDEALGSLAFETAEVSKDEAPWITRNLASSIAALHDGPMQWRVVTQTTGQNRNDPTKKSKIGYGAFVHMGTSKMTGNPFIHRGLQTAIKGIKGDWV